MYTNATMVCSVRTGKPRGKFEAPLPIPLCEKIKAIKLPLPSKVLQHYPGSKEETFMVGFQKPSCCCCFKRRQKPQFMRTLFVSNVNDKLLLIYDKEQNKGKRKSGASSTREGYCFRINAASSVKMAKDVLISKMSKYTNQDEHHRILEINFVFGTVIIGMDGEKIISEWCPILMSAFDPVIIPSTPCDALGPSLTTVNVQKQDDNSKATSDVKNQKEASNQIADSSVPPSPMPSFEDEPLDFSQNSVNKDVICESICSRNVSQKPKKKRVKKKTKSNSEWCPILMSAFDPVFISYTPCDALGPSLTNVNIQKQDDNSKATSDVKNQKEASNQIADSSVPPSPMPSFEDEPLDFSQNSVNKDVICESICSSDVSQKPKKKHVKKKTKSKKKKVEKPKKEAFELRKVSADTHEAASEPLPTESPKNRNQPLSIIQKGRRTPISPSSYLVDDLQHPFPMQTAKKFTAIPTGDSSKKTPKQVRWLSPRRGLSPYKVTPVQKPSSVGYIVRRYGFDDEIIGSSCVYDGGDSSTQLQHFRRLGSEVVMREHGTDSDKRSQELSNVRKLFEQRITAFLDKSKNDKINNNSDAICHAKIKPVESALELNNDKGKVETIVNNNNNQNRTEDHSNNVIYILSIILFLFKFSKLI
ncbi:hypothetical protein Mgra_00000135 [Meloidogyne graminicola]|uniref:Uncharacterized protein n=1 Tax=Meloidogyne graminicola TaxID=189291 RepID=A0A8T0A447_9BILA|nr:hypothetical protein Mgra_00000135 [Meloidogyne graminicola]